MEEYIDNIWQEIDYLPAGLDTAFSVPVNHRGSYNLYRMKFISYEGVKIYSQDISYGKQPDKEFNIRWKVNCIYFGEEVDYSIKFIDTVIKQGRADHVCLENFPSGVYYISVGDRTKKFFRK